MGCERRYARPHFGRRNIAKAATKVRMSITRIGVALSTDAHKQLGKITRQFDVSQSELFEALIWILSHEDSKDLVKKVRSRINELKDIESELRNRLRRMSLEEARKLLIATGDK
jgi:hypothetical protein